MLQSNAARLNPVFRRQRQGGEQFQKSQILTELRMRTGLRIALSEHRNLASNYFIPFDMIRHQ